ncbi:hypothetical protein MYX65_00300 [Acidobacteria bacterium AH-259-L09]|nr:hypothetical protein [Acidobacteria bacterium AH-259-L09]
MKPYKPERLFVERSVEDSPITQNVLMRLPAVAVEQIDSTHSLLEESQHWNPTIPRAKRSLILARHKGHFFKPCPASRTKQGAKTVCCNYFVINYASNCHMECSYCYLQSYLNFPYLIVYANCQDLLSELQTTFAENPHHFFRIGTGELADSLALDPLTSYSVPLVEFFAGQKNAVLEFRTKSNYIENLLNLDHRRKTVVSWSMNPPFIQEREEHKTATIGERLWAAEQCVQAGYPVAFHLDPLIFYATWETDYRNLIEEIFERIPTDSISWISLGSLRMTTLLKEIIRERFPNSFLPLGELVPSQDGKMRYFKPIRVLMYQKILGWIRAQDPRIPVYACMERPDVWTKVFQSAPLEEKELGETVIRSLSAT